MELKTIIEITSNLPIGIKVTLVGGGVILFSFVLRSFKELGNWGKMYKDKIHYNDN